MRRFLATILLLLCSFSTYADSIDVYVAPLHEKKPIEIQYRTNMDPPVADNTPIVVILTVNDRPTMAFFNRPTGSFHINVDETGPDEFFVGLILMVYGHTPAFSKKLRFSKRLMNVRPKGIII